MLKVFKTHLSKKYMRNVGIWLISLGVLILFLLGLVYYQMLDTVVNPLAFTLTFVVIFIVLILIITSFILKPKKKVEFKKIEEKKVEEKKVEEKKVQKKKK